MAGSGPFVLIHGAWHGGWCWERVAGPLRAAGHGVYTPTLPGLGDRAPELSDAITLEAIIGEQVALLEDEDLHDVILVGHSFGGVVITGVADRVPSRLRHLVYLDALILEDGQSPFSVVPSDVAEARRQQARDAFGGLAIPVPEPNAFGVTDPDDAQWLRTRCTPHPLSTYEDRLRIDGPVGNGVPATYVAVRPPYPPFAWAREAARARPEWAYREIDAGHDAMVTSPEALTALLLEVAADRR